jgi:hypothetical protein
MPTPWRAGWRIAFLLLGFVCALLLSARPLAQSLTYDLAYVRCPRSDSLSPRIPEVFRPTSVVPGCDLILRHPDGADEVLVAGGTGAVTDPYVTFDGKSILYAYSPDVRDAGEANKFRPAAGFDLFRIDLATKQITQLTHQEFTPNAASGTFKPPLINLGPVPVPGDQILFVSNRNGFAPTKPFTTVNLQLFIMDADGSHVQPIAPMTLGSALHPTPLMDGRYMFSSYESQGLRDWKQWGLWSIWPDGRVWEPLLSAFRMGQAFHFQTQLSNGRIAVIDYYNLNNGGFGTLYTFPTHVPAPSFFSAVPSENPPLTSADTASGIWQYRIPFSPKGIQVLTPWSSGSDAPSLNNAGKVTHPAGAPGNDLLLVYAAGAANLRTTGVLDAGIYRLSGGQATTSPSQLQLIVNDPAYNEWYPRAVVPYKAIYGIDQPHTFPFLPNDGSQDAALPAGTPYGIVGTSSLCNRESAPGDGLEVFNGNALNTLTGALANHWVTQGSDDGTYRCEDIDTIRIVTLEPTSEAVSPWSATGERLWVNHAIERTRILGEIPVQKTGVFDAQGHPDTSFRAKIPADTPFTFQLLDKNGQLVTMAQTWHQVRPGEVRTDCGGCHAHSQSPLDFATTAAASQPPVDLTISQPTDVEFLRDIRPILQAKCVTCHRLSAPAGNLALDDRTLIRITAFWLPKGTWPADYLRLAHDPDARWGNPPPSGGATWKHLNASRYVRMFQSRRSLLAWKAFNQRLDGWTNATFSDDLDYTTDHPTTLTEQEKRTIATWIDLGAPIDGGAYFADEQRPIVTVSSPRARSPLTSIRVGLHDVGRGLDLASLSITATVPLGNQPAGTNLAALATPLTDGILTIPVVASAPGSLTVTVLDRALNRTTQTVSFVAGTVGPTTPPPTEPPPVVIPPPSDPCVLAPLTFSVVRWPNASPGSRRLDYRWSGTGPLTVTFTATMAVASNPAGCTVTVTK